MSMYILASFYHGECTIYGVFSEIHIMKSVKLAVPKWNQDWEDFKVMEVTLNDGIDVEPDSDKWVHWSDFSGGDEG